jgi:hypothetical protein
MTRLSKKPLFFNTLVFLLLLVMFAGDKVLVWGADIAVSEEPEIAGKIIHGRVWTTAEIPVAKALVSAHRVEQDEQVKTLTDVDGFYELKLSAGLWSVTVEPVDITEPGNWLYPLEPQKVEFGHNDEPETHELNFKVTVADSGVTGVVEMPDGSVPPFTVTVGLHNGEGQGGRMEIDPANGKFKLALPHGRYDVIVHPHHDSYAGPHVEPVKLPPGEVVDLGRITLLGRDATISGQVTDNQGAGVAEMPVTAWQHDRPHLLSTRTDENGRYTLRVSGGSWHVQPAPGPDMPYFYLGEGQTVRIEAGKVVDGIDFEVLLADATIVGFLVTEDGERIHEVSGWASAVNSANPEIQSGAPIREGGFRIHVTRGDYLVSVELPPGSPYLAPEAVKTSVKSGETVTITVPLQKKDAVIGGGLVDPRQDRRPVTGVRGIVSAWSGDRWATTHIEPETGTYRLAVTAGIWHLNYRIDDEEYVKLDGNQNIPVQSGQEVKVHLPVTRKDAAIAGKVLSPDGRPLPGAAVIVRGLSGDIQGLRLDTRTNDHGQFHLRLPHGRYRVRATNGEPGWINPVEQIVSVKPETVVDGIVLRFHEPNAAIKGALTVLDTEAEGEVLVWAWSERGGFTKGRFPVSQTDAGGQASGRYELGVISGATWHVGAVFETDNELWRGRGTVKITENTTRLDLELSGPFPKPPPVVITFDSGQAQRLSLADDTKIFIPAGSMPVEGEVTLRIVPIAMLPHQSHAQVIQYGYAFFAADAFGRPIEEHFDHNVVIRFHYGEKDLNSHEVRLKPAYFSTTTNEWTVPEHFIVHPERNMVTMEIDHFTDFALVESLALNELFLPSVMR